MVFKPPFPVRFFAAAKQVAAGLLFSVLLVSMILVPLIF